MGQQKPSKKASPGGVTTDEQMATVTALAGFIRWLFAVRYRSAKLSREGVESNWGEKRMAKWDGGDDDNGTHKSTWVKVAQLCMEHQMDPAAFVQAQFAHILDRVPLPNCLLGPNAIARYQQHNVGAEGRLRNARHSEQRVYELEVKWRMLAREMDLNRAARSVLMDASFDLSGLFRYCTAAVAHETAVMERFHEQAFMQYFFQRAAYDRAWADFIPKTLRDEATAKAAAL